MSLSPIVVDDWFIIAVGSGAVGITNKQGQRFICLRILPDPVDDTDNAYDLFVKDWDLKHQQEPPSYDQGNTSYEGQVTGGLEKNYPYIKRIQVTGNVVAAVHRLLYERQNSRDGL